MRYLIFGGAGAVIFLMLFGFSVAAGSGDTADTGSRVVVIETTSDANQLRSEINRLRSIASIREVLEVHYPSTSIEEKRELAETIFEACEMYDLKVELVLAVIQTESAFNETAVSRKGAMGLMQVLPSTGIAMARELSMAETGRAELFDRRTNILLGCHYLKKMLNRYNSIDHALLAYNTGPTRFDLLLSSNARLSGKYARMVRQHMVKLSENHFNWDTGIND